MAQSLVEDALKAPVIRSVEVDRPDDLEYDLKHLAAVDSHPVDLASYRSHPAKYLLDTTRDVTQLLVNKLFSLPTRSVEEGRLAKLPEASGTVLPREKPVPKPKPPTKWELFAKEKGIHKRKKDKMAFDENLGEWRPTYGRDRANNYKDEWVIEAKPGDDPKVDPFLKKQQEKRERVQKGKDRQKKNLQGAAVAHGRPVPGALLVTNKALAKGPQQREKMKKTEKSDFMDSFKIAHFSTASMGKFDKKLKSEPHKISLGKRKRVDDVLGSNEKERTMKVLSRVIGSREDKTTHLTSKATKVASRISMKDKQKMKKQHLIGSIESGKKRGGFKKAKY